MNDIKFVKCYATAKVSRFFIAARGCALELRSDAAYVVNGVCGSGLRRTFHFQLWQISWGRFHNSPGKFQLNVMKSKLCHYSGRYLYIIASHAPNRCSKRMYEGEMHL